MIFGVFPYRWFYSWRDYIENPSRVFTTVELWYKNLRQIPRWLGWCWQRAFRGWADCDVWDMHSYVSFVFVPMLKAFRENTHGYPGYGVADTPEKWDALLGEMLEGFEAAKRVGEDDYYKIVNGDSLNAIFTATPNDVAEWSRLAKEDRKLFEKKMKVFTRWFFHLWD